MHPVNRALAYVEDHLGEEIGVEDIARASAISRHHLSRVFAHTTGFPLARYLRLRRLTEAAGLLIRSDDTVLTIALTVGYESHAVFTRAFNAEFGASPSAFRRHGSLEHLSLVNPIFWSPSMTISVPQPRTEANLSLTLVGLSRHVGDESDAAAEAMQVMARFHPMIPTIPHKIDPGYCHYVSDVSEESGLSYDFFAGVTVSTSNGLQDGLQCLDITWDRYLAFPFSLEIGRLEAFVFAIYADWFPSSGVQPLDGSHMQSYKPHPAWTLDPAHRLDGEVWVPIGR